MDVEQALKRGIIIVAWFFTLNAGGGLLLAVPGTMSLLLVVIYGPVFIALCTFSAWATDHWWDGKTHTHTDWPSLARRHWHRRRIITAGLLWLASLVVVLVLQ